MSRKTLLLIGVALALAGLTADAISTESLAHQLLDIAFAANLIALAIYSLRQGTCQWKPAADGDGEVATSDTKAVRRRIPLNFPVIYCTAFLLTFIMTNVFMDRTGWFATSAACLAGSSVALFYVVFVHRMRST